MRTTYYRVRQGLRDYLHNNTVEVPTYVGICMGATYSDNAVFVTPSQLALS